MSNVQNAQRPDGDGALSAGALGGARNQNYQLHYNISPEICQDSPIEHLEREATRHRQRAAHFATLADLAWRFGDQANRRKMQHAQMTEIRIADAIRRVLLGTEEAGRE